MHLGPVLVFNFIVLVAHFTAKAHMLHLCILRTYKHACVWLICFTLSSFSREQWLYMQLIRFICIEHVMPDLLLDDFALGGMVSSNVLVRDKWGQGRDLALSILVFTNASHKGLPHGWILPFVLLGHLSLDPDYFSGIARVHNLEEDLVIEVRTDKVRRHNLLYLINGEISAFVPVVSLVQPILCLFIGSIIEVISLFI